jgi:hypothetical protein
MFGVAQRQGRGLLILAAVAALILSACGGGSQTPAPSATAVGPTASLPVATSSPSGNGSPVLAGAGDALASLTSYKFRMTQAGTDSVNRVADLTGNGSSSNGSVTFNGTVILKPDKAAEVTTTGLHVISVGGFDYMDVGNAGFLKMSADSPGASPSSGASPSPGVSPSPASISDPFTPAQVFSKIRMSGYSNVGSETKNGVPSDHYQAGASALAELGSVSGVKGATWSADIWIAKDGGYPVSVALIAKAKDGTIPYETAFDLTNINDAANKVTAPENVMGA